MFVYYRPPQVIFCLKDFKSLVSWEAGTAVFLIIWFEGGMAPSLKNQQSS